MSKFPLRSPGEASLELDGGFLQEYDSVAEQPGAYQGDGGEAVQGGGIPLLCLSDVVWSVWSRGRTTGKAQREEEGCTNGARYG